MPESLASLGFAAWGAAGRLLEPAAPWLLEARARRGREVRARRSERLGFPSRPRPDGPLVWMHAASLGETGAILPLAGRLAQRSCHVLLTTGTVSAADLASRGLPGACLHQFAPLDLPRCVARFLDHWRPDLALFAESELWPATIDALHRRGVTLALVNARMSERSHRLWRRAGPFGRAVAARLTICLAQSEADAARYCGLGAPRVVVCGNAKFDAAPPPADARALSDLRRAVAGRPVWLAASTHRGEDEVVLVAHAGLAARHPGLLTLIAPRHPERGPEITQLAVRAGLAATRRAAGDVPRPGTSIHVADTLGEMGLWYRLASVTFLGGSLVLGGGHNPIEPASLDVPVLHGPHVANFAQAYAALDAAGAARRVRDADELLAQAGALLADPAERDRMAGAARACLDGFTGATDRIVDALAPWLPAARDASRA